jgi:Protein of unknown function (DUF4239)
MNPTIVFITTLVCLFGSAMVGLLLFEFVPPHHRSEETRNVIRLIANIFVVMTSLVMGLMINTAKNRFDGINRDLHAYATNLILLDRTLVDIGPETMAVRERLRAYVARAAVQGSFTSSDPMLVSDVTSEQLLTAVGAALRSISLSDDQRVAMRTDAQQEYRKILELRWALIEQADGSIPLLLLVMVICWLVLIFGSFGYGAPRNATVILSLLLAAGMIAAALDLILDLDGPFTGSISISSAPLQRALAEIQR